LENDRLDALVARRLDAPATEFKALDHIHEAGELTPGQLADRLALTSGAVTALIDRLERLGWVERAPNPGDRRSVIVRRAGPAESEGVQVYAPLADALHRAAAAMTAAQREATVRFLEDGTAAAREQADRLKRERDRR
jgi:DNA-binding MarR family transcriptional regulator